jgi:eukaryotic-like serine/threonine-protein kinase
LSDDCASDEVLARMATHTGLPDELEALREHVDDCPVCGAALLALIRASAPAPPTASTEMPAGTRVGRFTLREVLGSGNMGTVFTAWDPQLDRTLAIKVLRAGRDDAGHATRLLREAKAMAQVRHPNVVTVYEVGQDQDVIFVAMEQVRGPTLRAKLEDARPSIAARIDWLLQIGRALAAIHSAGLIHRDLKPDNVFIEDAEGSHRVVIGDFGLASSRARELERDVAGSLATGTRSAGTPAYSPPEQLHGDSLDARADVFAFGVTAWEVLTGARPFEGRTAATLEESIKRGPPPAPEVMPRAIADVIVRCLHHDRERRPRAIAEVTIALEAATRRPRHLRVLAIAGGGVLALAAVLVVATRRDDTTSAAHTPACDTQARARWDRTHPLWLVRAQQLSPFVREALTARMDERAKAWSREATAACGRDVLAQQAWKLCRPMLEDLEQRVLEVAVEQRWRDDQPIVQTLERLPSPAYCGSAEAAEDAIALSSLPSDAARASVAEGLGWLARADALDDLDADKACDEALGRAARIAKTISPSPLDGELALERVLMRPPSSPTDHVAALEAITATAERSGRASLIARSWLTLAERASELRVSDATIDSAFTQADWAISRLGDPPRLRVRWLAADGARAWTRGHPDVAKARFAAATKLAGDDRGLAWTSRLAVAKLASVAGDDHEAAKVYKSFLADPEFVRHARIEDQVEITAALAESLYRLGELAEAQRLIDEALERGRTALAPKHPQQIMAKIVASSIRLERGDGPAALALLDTATKEAREVLGEDHVLVGAARMATAQALLYERRIDEGVAAARDAARIFELREGRRHENSITARFLIADALRVTGKFEQSEKQFAELVADAEALTGTDHPLWAQVAKGHADVLFDLDRNDEAIALLERIIPVLVKSSSPDTAALARFQLARIVESRNHARAIALAAEAEVALRGDPAWAEDRENVAKWIRSHKTQVTRPHAKVRQDAASE